MTKYFLVQLWIALTIIFTGLSAYAAPPGRIVSLAPSLTEIMYSLGLGNNIVGVTISCDRPPEARRKRKVGGMANPSIEAVVALRPDVVVMTRDGNPKVFAERLDKFHIRTVVFQARRLSELSPEIRRMAKALGAEMEGEKLANRIDASLKRFTAPLPSVSQADRLRKKRALFIISPEPLIAVGPGTIIDDAMTLLGLENIVSDSRVSYPALSLERIIRGNPGIIFIGYAPGMYEGHAARLLKRLANVDAVQKGRVYDISDTLYRPGPRIPEGIEEMRRLINRRPE